LAALEAHVAASPTFTRLAQQAAVADTGRPGGHAPAAPTKRFAMPVGRSSFRSRSS
jgi:hypothetical protein